MNTSNKNESLSKAMDKLPDAKGNIDGVFGSMLAGWFYCESDLVDCKLSLFVDGVDSLEVNVDESRPDVGKNLGFGENSGFSFDLSTLELNDVVELTIKHKKSGYDFFSKSYMYSSSVVEYKKQISDIFFPQFYRNKYQLAHLSNEESLHHYLSVGIYADYDPCPWFDHSFYREKYGVEHSAMWLPVVDYIEREAFRLMQDIVDTSKASSKNTIEAESDNAFAKDLRCPSVLFDPAHYLEKNTDLEAYPHLLGHFVQFGRIEGRVHVERSVPDHIQKELKSYLDIEPALRSISQNIDFIVRYPFFTASTYLPNLTKQKFEDRIKVVVCVPFISVGGADLLATHMVEAYEREYGENSVLLIVTSSREIEVEAWVDSSTNVLLLERECDFVDRDDKVGTLHRVISTLAPEKIINVNSSECWDLYRNYGMQLSSVLNLYAYAFCFDYDAEGRRAGYIPEYIPEMMEYLTKVYCDNSSIVEEIREIYGFSDEVMRIFHTLYSPLPDTLPQRSQSTSVGNQKILWAGRLAHQKRPDLLVKIASALPNEKFVVYGPKGNSKVSDDIISGKYKNIEYAGVYSDLSELSLDDYSLYLNTSQWDGIPTMLLILSAVGMPIVTSNVGGIGEIIDDTTGWIVSDSLDVMEYVTTIRKTLINSQDTHQRAARGLERTREIHCWKNYLDSLAKSGAFLTRDELKNQYASRLVNSTDTMVVDNSNTPELEYSNDEFIPDVDEEIDVGPDEYMDEIKVASQG